MQILEKYPVSTFCAPPTAYRFMIQEKLKEYKFPALRHCMSAGEPLVRTKKQSSVTFLIFIIKIVNLI